MRCRSMSCPVLPNHVCFDHMRIHHMVVVLHHRCLLVPAGWSACFRVHEAYGGPQVAAVFRQQPGAKSAAYLLAS